MSGAAATLRIDIVSLFPEMVRASLDASIPARAVERGLAQINYHNLR
jgi:tRNA (guanine37-N1)-methyltransferase